MAELKRSAFYDVQDQLGPEWTDWEGWAWAGDFGDALAEHEATRNASNLWDESPLRKWDMQGKDALGPRRCALHATTWPPWRWARSATARSATTHGQDDHGRHDLQARRGPLLLGHEL